METPQIQKEEFTGVWIPREVLLDDNLTVNEKIIYAEIACFETCYKTNEQIGDRYNLKPNTISIIISKLKEHGYVVDLGFNGNRRTVAAVKDFYRKRAVKKSQKDAEGMTKIKGRVLSKSNPGFDLNQRQGLIKIKGYIDNSKEYNKEHNKEYEISHSPSANENDTSLEQKNSSQKQKYTNQDVRLTELLFDLMHNNAPELKRKEATKKDYEEMNRINRLDGLDYKLIEGLIVWCQNDTFWSSNILSVKSLRKQSGRLLRQARISYNQNKVVKI